ncbi:MAG: transcriptional repressor, partial [Acetatifactor sp.]|nr:transcriptional repressor [Acetatifactor sp.]
MMEEKKEIEYPQGIKWTKQRKNVYTVLQKAAEPLTAVQIYHLSEKLADGEEYALSTIYRILTAFEEKGIVSKSAWMGDGTMVYELNRGEHTHYAVCLECHKRIALQSCPFAHIHME